ncbi:MAG: hypothetical protein HYU37_01010 [Acidobacteria bacterium]|nr:hypothetical protein [Acidobacteriota bacterium]
MRISAVLFGLLVLTAPAARAQRPAENPPDVKALVFAVADSIGMLRGLQQEDSILTLEEWAKGTMTVGGQTFDVPEHRTSINFSVPGMRVDYRRQGSGGQPQRQIEVVAGGVAWNETERGRGATPARDKARERLVYLWTTPMGVLKAARAAGAKATMKTSGGATVLSFPLPAPVDDVTAHVTLRKDASLLARPNPNALTHLIGTYIARVETDGGVATDTTYAEYGDWNWDDYKADIMLPRRTTRKHGATTLELTTVNTNTYNPYVVMPVPENVK